MLLSQHLLVHLPCTGGQHPRYREKEGFGVDFEVDKSPSAWVCCVAQALCVVPCGDMGILFGSRRPVLGWGKWELFDSETLFS